MLSVLCQASWTPRLELTELFPGKICKIPQTYLGVHMTRYWSACWRGSNSPLCKELSITLRLWGLPTAAHAHSILVWTPLCSQQQTSTGGSGGRAWKIWCHVHVGILGGLPEILVVAGGGGWQELVVLWKQVGTSHWGNLSRQNSVPYNCAAWDPLGYI